MVGHENIKKISYFGGKSASECYRSLKEIWGTCASYETVHRWVNAIKNGWEETYNTLPVEPQQWQWMNTKCNLSLNIFTVFYAWQLLQRSLSLLRVFIIPSPTAWGKYCVKWIPHMLISDQRTMLVLAATHLQHWRNTGSVFLIHILMVDGSWMLSFDPQLTWQNADWRDTLSLRKIAQHSQLALKVVHIMFCGRKGLVLDHPMPIGIMVSGWYDSPLLQDKVRLAVHHEQPELLEHGVMMCKVWCSVGAGKCWHILPALQVSPHVIIGCLHVWKNVIVENDLNWKMISAVLLLPLYTIWARTIIKLQLIIYHVDGKSVWTVLVITLQFRSHWNNYRLSQIKTVEHWPSILTAKWH